MQSSLHQNTSQEQRNDQELHQYNNFCSIKDDTFRDFPVTSEVEAVVNSLPLTYIYEDEVKKVLTPSRLYCER